MGSGSLSGARDGFVKYVVGSVELPIGSFAPTYLPEGFNGVDVMCICLAIAGYEGSRVDEESQRSRESSSS